MVKIPMTPEGVEHSKRATSFAHGERGKYAGMVDIFVGATDRPLAETKQIPNPLPGTTKLIVTIDDDLRASFPDADAVNQALRTLVRVPER